MKNICKDCGKVIILWGQTAHTGETGRAWWAPSFPWEPCNTNWQHVPVFDPWLRQVIS